MTWELIDPTDPLGTTRYVAEPSIYILGGVDVWVHRHSCRAWHLIAKDTLAEAQAYVSTWIEARQRDQAEREAQRKHA